MTALGEQVVADFDRELSAMVRVENLDDATHAKDLVETLTKRLDDLEEALRLQNLTDTELGRARANAAANAGKVTLEEALPIGHRDLKPAKWIFTPLHAEIADAVGVLKVSEIEKTGPGRYAAEVRLTNKSSFDGRVRIHWSEGFFQAAMEQAEFDCLNTVGLSFELDERQAGVVAHHRAERHACTLDLIEITKQGGPRTALPGLPVSFPTAMPLDDADLLGETREEMEARLAQVKAIAGVYTPKEDSRNPVQISVDDLIEAEKNRTKGKDDRAYAAKFSDDPTKKPGLAAPTEIAGVEKMLKIIYEGAGMKVRNVVIRGESIHLVLEDRILTVPLPKELVELVQKADASTRR